MPDVEYWTYGAVPTPGRIGFNFGAPGDRRAADGTLWLAVPNFPDQMARDKTLWWGNDAAVDQDYVPRPDVSVEPNNAPTFYHHSSRIAGDAGIAWVAASGVEGVRSLTVPLAGIRIEAPFGVRLHFAEPTLEQPGQRVFDVSIDGEKWISDLDLVRQTGGPRRSFVVDLPRLKHSGRKSGSTNVIQIELRARSGSPVIGGVEIIQEPVDGTHPDSAA
jgi:hypothetical protein